MAPRSDGREPPEDELKLGVCALDADAVGAPAEGARTQAFDGRRLRSAVHGLQQAGLKVILVSRQDCRAALNTGLSGGPAIDSQSLMHVRAVNDTVIDLLKTADDHRCPFVTNEDVGRLVAEEDWRLPWRRLRWLRRVEKQARISWVFGPNGEFGACFPDQVRQFLSGKGRATSRKQGADSPSPPASPEFVAQPAGAPPSPSPPRPAALGGPTAWLGCEEETSAALQEEAAPRSSRGVERGSGRGAQPEPPPPPRTAPCGGEVPPARKSAAAVEGLGQWTVDGGFPPVAVLTLRSSRQRLFVVHCGEKSAWLFPYSRELVKKTARSEEIDEQEEDDEVEFALAQPGAMQFLHSCFMIVTAKGGPCRGMKAVGLAPKREARQRAARLALAAAVRANYPNADGWVEDPTGDGEFHTLVKRARRLLRQGSGSAEADEEPPPPPPGPPPPGFAASLVLPPPPPAPPSPRFSNASHGCAAARDDAQSKAFNETAGLLLKRLLSDDGGANEAPGGGAPATAALASEDVPAAAGTSPLHWLRPDRSETLHAAEETPLSGRRARATGVYEAEGDGYLPLRLGDTLQLKWDLKEPPGPQDQFGSYVYGARVAAVGTCEGDAPAKEGWFPFQLIQLL